MYTPANGAGARHPPVRRSASWDVLACGGTPADAGDRHSGAPAKAQKHGTRHHWYPI